MKTYTLDNEQYFDEVIKLSSRSLVIIDFNAEWCQPCKRMSMIFDDISSDYDYKAFVVKIDVDKFDKLAQKFDVQSMPTIIFIKSGTIVEKYTGLIDKYKIMNLIDQYIFINKQEDD